MIITQSTAIVIASALVVVLVAVIGLIVLAGQNPTSLPIVIPILASIVTGFATAAAAIITHIVGANFELRRNGTNDIK